MIKLLIPLFCLFLSGCYTTGLQYAISTATAIPIVGEAIQSSIPTEGNLGTAKIRIKEGVTYTIRAKKHEPDGQ